MFYTQNFPTRAKTHFKKQKLMIREGHLKWWRIYKLIKEKNLPPRTPSKALIQALTQIREEIKSVTDKRIQHHQISFTTKAKGTSLDWEKKRPQLERRKSQMGTLTSKGKCTVKVGNHPHTNTTSKSASMRIGKHKCKKWETHLKLRDQQLKTTLCVCVCVCVCVDCYIKTSWEL